MRLVKFELEKVSKDRLLLSAILLLFLVGLTWLAWVFYYDINPLQSYFDDDTSRGELVQENEEYMRTFSGDLTDERIQMILVDYIDKRQSNYTSPDLGMFPYDVAHVFTKDYETFHTQLEAANTAGEKLSLSEVDTYTVAELGFYGYQNNTEPQQKLKIGNFLSWNNLFVVMSYFFNFIAIVIILICSTFFSSEVSRETLSLLYTTKHGRNELIRAKLATACVLTFLLFTVAQVVNFIIFYFFFGLNGWDVSIQTNLDWQVFDFPIILNNLQVFFLIYAFQLIGLWAVASISCLVSSLTSNPFASLAVALSLYFAPRLIKNLLYLPASDPVAKLLELFPINNFHVGRTLPIMRSKDTFFFDGYLPNLLLLLALWIFVKLAADCLAYFRMKYLSLE